MTSASVMQRAVAVLLVSAAAAGCGSSGDPRPVSAATATATVAAASRPGMTHREFVAALNASCTKDQATEDRLTKQFESAMERSDLPAAGRTYESMMRVLAAHVDRIQDLQPATTDRAAFHRYMKAERRIVGIGGRITRALKKGAGVAELSGPFSAERNRRLTAAVDIGADECGS